jgi:hypothetical protein
MLRNDHEGVAADGSAEESPEVTPAMTAETGMPENVYHHLILVC